MIMPEMSGKECLERLIELDPKMKVVVASGFFMNGAAEEAVQTLSRGFVSKPFDVKELRSTIRRILDQD